MTKQLKLLEEMVTHLETATTMLEESKTSDSKLSLIYTRQSINHVIATLNTMITYNKNHEFRIVLGG